MWERCDEEEGDDDCGQEGDESGEVWATNTKTEKAKEKTTLTRGTKRGPRAARLEALDDGLGPLGPLCEGSIDDNKQDGKSSFPGSSGTVRATSVPTTSTSTSVIVKTANDSTVKDNDVIKLALTPPPPPPAKLSPDSADPRDDEDELNSLYISVGDAHKVGDITNSHVVYSVRSKIGQGVHGERVVGRRYRDFLWLYDRLTANNPGTIVPAPPEKQAINRFEAGFVELRRQALQRMLRKIAVHTRLRRDEDFRLFLQSDSFNIEIKTREVRDTEQPRSVMAAAIGWTGSSATSASISVGAGAGGGSGSTDEDDEWFEEQRSYINALDAQLRGIQQALDGVTGQRKNLVEGCSDLARGVVELSRIELASDGLRSSLEGLAEVQARLAEVFERASQQDVLTLGLAVDEYVRMVGSVKTAMAQRQRAREAWKRAETDWTKRRREYEKLRRRASRTLDVARGELDEAQRKCAACKRHFEEIAGVLKCELRRFDTDKVEDFKCAVETFLESAIETQKEIIEVWESYALLIEGEC